MIEHKQIRYGPLEFNQYAEVSHLLVRVFKAHIAPHYSQEGIDEFLSYARSDALLERSMRNHFLLAAKVMDDICGVIEVRDHCHISLLFVDSPFQRHGIGRELLRRALRKCRAHNPKLKAVTVNSSPNAVGAYERLGFQASAPLRIKHGIAFVPMVLSLEAE